MKALLITPENRSIEEMQISGKDDIVRLVGYDTLESDVVGDLGDRLFFDEECFLRATPGRFQVDSLNPVSDTILAQHNSQTLPWIHEPNHGSRDAG